MKLKLQHLFKNHQEIMQQMHWTECYDSKSFLNFGVCLLHVVCHPMVECLVSLLGLAGFDEEQDRGDEREEGADHPESERPGQIVVVGVWHPVAAVPVNAKHDDCQSATDS